MINDDTCTSKILHRSRKILDFSLFENLKLSSFDFLGSPKVWATFPSIPDGRRSVSEHLSIRREVFRHRNCACVQNIDKFLRFTMISRPYDLSPFFSLFTYLPARCATVTSFHSRNCTFTLPLCSALRRRDPGLRRPPHLHAEPDSPRGRRRASQAR